ncbi:MAG: GAF domain-containing protein, partial [Pseudomonadota bacterium]
MTRTDNHSDSELMQIGALIEAIYNLQSQEALYQKIVSVIPGFIAADRVSVTRYDETSRQIEMVALFGAVDPDGRMKLGERVSIGKDYQQYHDSVCEPVIWQPEVDAETTAGGTRPSTAGLVGQMKMKSVMNVPILRRGRIVGTLNVGSRSVDYSASDLALLKQITTLLGVAVERIAFNEIQQAANDQHRLYADHLELLNAMGEKLSLITSIDEAFESVSDCAKSLVNAVRVSYCELEPDKKNIRIIGLVGATT